ncbi:MFS transporter [Nioella nitratireducens]|uniref:MFS transporter n=1 Tax=Nioella nitratireducens TaxID=1287720 RepID=UPI0008FCF4E3|nr:MFS transporter [Nioella nitratireducens]
MKQVIASAWAILFGLMLLQVGNSLQGTLMGVRGGIEGFTTFQLSLIASAYFGGFLFGSRLAPRMIRRVGHVRVFAALGSFISAALILYPVWTDPYVWMALRVLIGFSLSGVYVTTESWLNNSATNETRGQALSAYMLVQMVGLVLGQGLLNLGDPSGFVLFIIPSVLVSLSFAPILLAVAPTPAFETTRPMSLLQLYKNSPLGFVGMILLGFVYSAQFGMAAVYGTEAGLSVVQISMFVSAFFIGGIVFQFPVGWLSDRMDRRILIFFVALLGAMSGALGFLFGDMFEILLVVAVLTGGLAQPLYALLIAYTNDYLEVEDMAAASGGLVFINGLGAIAGPPVLGWLMGRIGPSGFWLFLAITLAVMAGYGGWRMTRRQSVYAGSDDYESVSYTPIMPSASPVIVETAQELYAEATEEMAEAEEEEKLTGT